MSFQNLKLSITEPSQIDLLSDQLMEAGALAITLEDAGDNPIFEPLPNEILLWQETILSALFPSEFDLQLLIKTLQNDHYIRDCSQEPVPDHDWQELWTQTTEPLCFYDQNSQSTSQCLWVCPSFSNTSELEGTIVRLDPGLAFGTGTHPTTALCLNWLAGNLPTHQQVIDYGCGSGILSIAALKLGAAKVYAIDHDPQALQATESNARLNTIDSSTLVVALPDLASNLLCAQNDLILANILANPLIQLSDYFTSLLKPEGYIVLSGILIEQVETVMAAYADGFDDMHCIEKEGWAMISGCKK